ncbi:MAG: hypothetical protein JZD41_00365 [Thermoproteus sp.]|nr:hypothetical protein [Thermoproteus sp.]
MAYADEAELNALAKSLDIVEKGSIYKADIFYRGEKIAFRRQIFDWWNHGRKFFVDPYTEELTALISEDPRVELKVSWPSSKARVRARDEKALESAARALAEFARAYLIAERLHAIDSLFKD